MRGAASGLTLAEFVEDIKHDFVALKILFRKSANPVRKLDCFYDNCIPSQKERDKENKYLLNFHGKQY